MTENLSKETEVVRVIYVSTNAARTQIYGASRTLGGHPYNYGYRKPGDVFDAIVQDVILRPDMFHAYPCDKPFIIKGKSLENPCGDVGTKKQHGMLEDIPGIGPKIAERLVGMGINTPEDVVNNVDDDILNGLPPRARKAIKEWQDLQK